MKVLERKGFTDSPLTLGQHLRNRRLANGLQQREVARQLGTIREVYERWERDELLPTVRFWPGLAAFLGYYPYPDDGTVAHLVSKVRKLTGLGQFAFGRRIGAIAQDVRAWEHGARIPKRSHLERLRTLAATLPWFLCRQDCDFASRLPALLASRHEPLQTQPCRSARGICFCPFPASII